MNQPRPMSRRKRDPSSCETSLRAKSETGSPTKRRPDTISLHAMLAKIDDLIDRMERKEDKRTESDQASSTPTNHGAIKREPSERIKTSDKLDDHVDIPNCEQPDNEAQVNREPKSESHFILIFI